MNKWSFECSCGEKIFPVVSHKAAKMGYNNKPILMSVYNNEITECKCGKKYIVDGVVDPEIDQKPNVTPVAE